MKGVTVDTGVLIGWEKGKPKAAELLEAARRGSVELFVPTVVVAEWWRGGRTHERLLRDVEQAAEIEPLSLAVAKAAAEAMAAVRGATLVDAVVMASAAQRGDAVYTSDWKDMIALKMHFRTVHVVSL